MASASYSKSSAKSQKSYGESKNAFNTEKYWESKIHKGLEWRKNTSKEDAWNRIKNYYEHNFKNTGEPHFNLIYTLATSVIPMLVFQSPNIINRPRRAEFAYWGRFYDGIDNWLVDELEVQDTIEQAVLNGFLYNNCGLEIGFEFGQEGEKTITDKEGDVDVTHRINQPWVDVVQPERLIIAPGTRSMRNCPWYAKHVLVKTETLRGIKGVKKGAIEGTHIPQEVSNKTGNKYMEDDPDECYTSLYIVHEAEQKTWCWISSEGKFILPPQEDPLQVDGLPLEFISFNRGSHGLWGTPDALYVESQQLEGDECRRDGRLQRKAALVKAFYDVNLIDEQEIEDFITSSALGCIPVNVPAEKSLSDCIQLVQAHVQTEYPMYQKELLNDAQLITGNGPNQLGMYAPGRRSKFEAQTVEERNFLRSGSRREKIAGHIGKTFGRVNQLIAKYWTGEIVQQVLGVEGATYWVKARPSEMNDIKGQLCTTVSVASLAPVSQESRRKEMGEVLGILSKFQNINPIPIVQAFLQSFDWANISQILPNATPNGPIGMQEFAGQQQALAGDPAKLSQMAQANMGGAMGAINQLPRGTTYAGGEDNGSVQ